MFSELKAIPSTVDSIQLDPHLDWRPLLFILGRMCAYGPEFLGSELGPKDGIGGKDDISYFLRAMSLHYS